mmetsp:Transcript_38602/g.87009  ORF Transcript_38602/g.87009 Transcript_38602/m.87009 type:complete len:699 (+) Transcript_38602:141-2237(+)
MFEEFMAEIFGDEPAAAANTGDRQTITYHHVVDALIITVFAWLSLSVTLETNGFRQRLLEAFCESPTSKDTSNRYVAALVAVRYGLRDALIDWMLIYTVCYAIVGGLTWKHAEPNSVIVIWGFSLMLSSVVLGIVSLKITEWLGIYRASKLKVIKDISGFAHPAVEKLTSEGATIDQFRYQVRLGVGKHFSQFTWILLPFFVGLKFWFYLLSILIGVLCGHLFMFLVFECRKRFQQHRKRVAVIATAICMLGSATCFLVGIEVVDKGWDRFKSKTEVVLTVAFFFWLVIMLMFQGFKYYEHLNFGTNAPEIQLFASPDDEDNDDEVNDGEAATDTVGEGITLEEPLLGESNPRDIMKKDSGLEVGYFYQTAYFDRIKHSQLSGSASSDELANLASGEPHEIYEAIVDMEKGRRGRLLTILPIKPLWDLFMIGTRDTCRCCFCGKDAEFQAMSCGRKSWFALRKLVKVLLNLGAIFMAGISCAAAVQTSVTMSKLPYVRAIYLKLNEGEVCAYDNRCGTIQTFPSKEDAHLANYSVAHCKRCAHCSTWQDLKVQWTTRLEAAKLAQACGIRYLFDQEGMAKCLSNDMGWTHLCSEAWVHSVVCARKQCGAIATLSIITNRMGNFDVDPNAITAATCNEAQCEQGNPGNFAKLSGASRRKMNIKSSIGRPPDQQCQIVDNIPLTTKGYNNWEDFFSDPYC